MSQGIQNRSAEHFCLSCGICVACIAKNTHSFQHGRCKLRQRTSCQFAIMQALESNRSHRVPTLREQTRVKTPETASS